MPLFTIEDSEKALKQLEAVDFDEPVRLSPASTARLIPSGHILGAAMVMVSHDGGRLLFSGDLGRPNDPQMRPPSQIDHVDALVLESTYGDRLHPSRDPEDELFHHLDRVLRRGGVVVIPAFAVGRAQTILLLLARLKAKGKIADVL